MLNDILDDQLDFNSGRIDEKNITEINLLKIDANEHVKHIKGGRTALIVLAVFTIIGAFIGVAVGNEYANSSEILIEAAILLTIYGLCAVFVKKNPSASLLTGLIVYVLVILLSALVDTSSIFSGIIVKGLIIYYLSIGTNSAFELKKTIQKLRRLGISDKELNHLKELDTILKTKRKSRPDDIQ